MMKYNFPHRVDDNISVWEEFKYLATQYNCLSLGEGAPAQSPPDFLIEHMCGAIKESASNNQYTRTFGNLELVTELAHFYGSKLGKKIDPLTEVLVGPGGTNVLVNALVAYLNPGDEVLVFEPGWPCYYDMVQYAGGVCRGVPLTLAQDKWLFDSVAFENKITQLTKVVIINNAQNPTGKLFNEDELLQMTNVLQKYPQIIVISDDVYEFLNYDGPFIPFASLKDNYERTLTCYDGGKLFCCTGWTVAWALGPPSLIAPLSLITSTVVYSVNTPAQIAIARAL